MTPLRLDFKKSLAALLVLAFVCACFPSSVFAQSVGGSPTTPGNYQSGNGLENLVVDTTGAVAAAALACNKTKIQSSIKKLFGGSSSDSTDNGAANLAGMAAALSNNPSSSSGSGNSTVTLNPSDPTTKALLAGASNTGDISAADQAILKKQTCTNAIQKAAAGAILRSITLSTVNWINHGMNGNPFYSTDTGATFKSLSDQTIKQLTNTFGFNTKNYPFGQAVMQGLVNQVQQSFAQSAQYSLNGVIAQQYPGSTAADFRRDLGIGGWNAFIAQSMWKNNPFGFALKLQNQAASQLQGTNYSPAQDLKDQLQRSGGFFDQKVCVDPNYQPSAANNGASSAAAASEAEDARANNELATAQQAAATAAAAAAANPNDPGLFDANQQAQKALQQAQAAATAADQASATAEATLATSNSKATCNKYQTQTPGAVIAHALTTNMDTSTNQLINGQDLSKDIAAIFDALSNQLINKGLSSLSTNGTPNTNFANNTNGVTNSPVVTNTTVDGTTPDGTWSQSQDNFNVFTDIPGILRYEDNDVDNPGMISGCTKPTGFDDAGGHFCVGDPTLPEGYQQILKKEVSAQTNVISSIYELDYCIPGPAAGAIDSIDTNATNFIADPNRFPASSSTSDLKKVLVTYGSAIGMVAGVIVGVVVSSALIGTAIGSAVPGIGTAIGAVVGLIVGFILYEIGNNKDFENEEAYGGFMDAVMGLNFDYDKASPNRATMNGHGNAGQIVTIFAHRYYEAMKMVYEPTLSDVSAMNAMVSAPGYDPSYPNDRQPTATTTSASGVVSSNQQPTTPADLSTTNAKQAQIINDSYQAFQDISDLTAIDKAEYPNIQSYKDSVSTNQDALNTSVSIESQLIHLLAKIGNLHNDDGYPGLTAPLGIVPIIKLNGDAAVTIAENATYTDAGATASDNQGDLTSKIVTVSNVDTTTPGTYTITYDVTNPEGVAANQVTRTVEVLDDQGNVNTTIMQNYAAQNVQASQNAQGLGVLAGSGPTAPTGLSIGQQASIAAGYAVAGHNTAVAAGTTQTVRDYNKDLQTIQNVTNQSTLSDYEVDLLRISNTFNQLAPYIHGPDDLKSAEGDLSTMQNEAGNIATFDSKTGTLKSGALYACIQETFDPSNPTYVGDGGDFPASLVTKQTPRYIKDGGPTGRLLFPYVVSNDGKVQTLPTWLVTALPPTQSFLPNWHYSEGSGINVIGKNYFPADGQPDYPSGINNQVFFFPQYWGDPMMFNNGDPGDPLNEILQPQTNAGEGVTLDANKIIRSTGVSEINLQPIKNAMSGLENILWMF